jgi:hypothetical protein
MMLDHVVYCSGHHGLMLQLSVSLMHQCNVVLSGFTLAQSRVVRLLCAQTCLSAMIVAASPNHGTALMQKRFPKLIRSFGHVLLIHLYSTLNGS